MNTRIFWNNCDEDSHYQMEIEDPSVRKRRKKMPILPMVNRFIMFLQKLSKRNYTFLKHTKLHYLFDELNQMGNKNKGNIVRKRQINNVTSALDDYCRSYVMFGFNSGSFDTQCLRSYGFFEALQKTCTKKTDPNAKRRRKREINILKKDGHYLQVSSERIVFKDIISFLGNRLGGLKQFIANFGFVGLKGKLHFPYAFLSSLDKLSQPITAIRKKHFRDALIPGSLNSLGQDRRLYARLMKQYKMKEKDVLCKMKLSERPKDALWKINALQRHWENKKKYKTVKELLTDYSHNDSAPLLLSINAYQKSFQPLGLSHGIKLFLSLSQEPYGDEQKS